MSPLEIMSNSERRCLDWFLFQKFLKPGASLKDPVFSEPKAATQYGILEKWDVATIPSIGFSKAYRDDKIEAEIQKWVTLQNGYKEKPRWQN